MFRGHVTRHLTSCCQFHDGISAGEKPLHHPQPRRVRGVCTHVAARSRAVWSSTVRRCMTCVRVVRHDIEIS